MHILIVDDHAINRKLLKITLEAEGYTTAEAEDGLEALQILRYPAADLIISDLLMPNMDGFSLCSEVARRTELDHLSIILYTATDLTQADERLGLELGADRFVKKQASSSFILQVIKEIISQGQPRRSKHPRSAGAFSPEKVMRPYSEVMIRKLEENSIELEQTRDQLRDLNQKLEQRVAERTQELREKNEQMEEELKMARELQMALLPQQFPSIPRGVPLTESAIKFSSFYYPAGSVSGDFFTVNRFSDTAVAVLMVDVMGHGVRAGLITAMMRALVDKFSVHSADPAAMLSRINHSLFGILKHTRITLFATAFYLIVDTSCSRMRYANAGHPKPLLLRRNRNAIEQMSANGGVGPALGLFDHAEYRTQESSMELDDFIMLYTDGLFEVEAPDSELYSRDRLIAAVRQHANLESSALLAQLFTDIRRFSNRTEFNDDVCLLGLEIRRLGPSNFEQIEDRMTISPGALSLTEDL